MPSSPLHITSSFTASPTSEIPKPLHNGHSLEPTVASTVQVPKVQNDDRENCVNNCAINSSVDENDAETATVIGDFADFVGKNESMNELVATAPDSDDNLPDLDLKLPDAADDFDDFGDFESNVPESATKDDEEIELETEDDFGNFNSSAMAVSLSKDDLVKKTEQMIKDIFKADDAVYPEFQPEDFTKNNPVFNKLKIIENTHALNFQWNNAEGQTMLLKSLNIDSRNIVGVVFFT